MFLKIYTLLTDNTKSFGCLVTKYNKLEGILYSVKYFLIHCKVR